MKPIKPKRRRRRMRPSDSKHGFMVTLDCGHHAVTPRLPRMGDELVCAHPHASNRRERVVSIRSA